MRKLTYLCFLLLISCSNKNSSTNEPFQTIAFGSCSHQSKVDQQLWKEVINEDPDLWIWLGDNIYADTEDMDTMKAYYDLQKSHVDYQKLLNQTDVIGIWDDHDLGGNDVGKEYPKKDESRDLLFDFLDVGENDPSRSRKGAYQSYSYNLNEKKLKIILLDTRYFRDSLKWIKEPKTALINEDGSVLGDAQWNWLRSELTDTDVDLFVVASGIQVLPKEHRFEKWANFPNERKKLLKMVADIVEVPLVFFSGDRHISEISKIDLEGYKFPLYELTSSSLTNPWYEQFPEENAFRIGQIIYPTNFAVLDIKWNNMAPLLNLKFVGEGNEILQDFSIMY